MLEPLFLIQGESYEIPTTVTSFKCHYVVVYNSVKKRMLILLINAAHRGSSANLLEKNEN